jgi:predicted DNA-binding transcriptional regulator YafY
MRADRLLSIMLLLQVHRRLTARELAQRLEVSERTVHRDMEALSAAGIPVVAERGTGGGWRLLEDYRTNLTGLTAAEVQALFLTGPPRLLADLGLDKASEAAFIKLLAAVPSISRRGAEYARQRIYVDTGGWRQPDEAYPFLPLILEAIWQERRLRLTYQRGENGVERVVDPLGLVAKGSAWYLVASIDGELRTYRVSRIQDAQLVDGPCARPPDFDLAAYWRQSSAEFKAGIPRYSTVVRVDAALLPRLRSEGWNARIEREYPPDADGRVTLALALEGDEDRAGEVVLGYGAQIEVLEPQSLREKVLHAAQGIVARYVHHVS